MTFQETLYRHALQLTRDRTTALQVNLGRLCDLACRHCHLTAGPDRVAETMSRETAAAVVDCASRLPFSSIDLTGGAPELIPHLPELLESLAPRTPRLIVRTNLVALARPHSAGLAELYRRHRVVVVASLPASNPAQTEAQRGTGVWEQSVAGLQRLNALGYGHPDSGLELNLAANPTGAFLPVSQPQAERRFRDELWRRHKIVFNHLFTFANVPLGRFRAWLQSSGNFDDYTARLAENFNPATLPGLMCRSQLSVDWDGWLYDCDFNLAAGLPHGGRLMHISSLGELPPAGTPIPVGPHCFSCTAGSGFTCGGSIA